jgi:hypothetical protein
MSSVAPVKSNRARPYLRIARAGGRAHVWFGSADMAARLRNVRFTSGNRHQWLPDQRPKMRQKATSWLGMIQTRPPSK